MPELPEVECIVRQLRKLLIQVSWIKYKVECIHLFNLNVLHQKSLRSDLIFRQEEDGVNFYSKINLSYNQTIQSIERRGKTVILNLEDQALIFYLGLTGRILVQPLEDQDKIRLITSYPLNKHVQCVIPAEVTLGSTGRAYQIVFDDIRKFGKLLIVDKANLDQIFQQWGPEPLGDDFNLIYALKYKKLKTPVKLLIMNNKFVVGIGNIYACEALFQSKILPTRPYYSLCEKELKCLILAIKAILQESIQKGGTTFRDYKKPDGSHGNFQNFLKVYRIKLCLECNSAIKRETLGGRSTYFCARCQK